MARCVFSIHPDLHSTPSETHPHVRCPNALLGVGLVLWNSMSFRDHDTGNMRMQWVWVLVWLALTAVGTQIAHADPYKYEVEGTWECEARNTDGRCESWVLKNGKIDAASRCFPGDVLVMAHSDLEWLHLTFRLHMAAYVGFGTFRNVTTSPALKRMRDVETGDYILAPKYSRGSVMPSTTRVIGWFHRDPTAYASYLSLCSAHTAHRSAPPEPQTSPSSKKICLTVSPEHHVYTRENAFETANETAAHAHTLRTLYGWHELQTVKRELRQGMFAPITQNQRYYVGDPKSPGHFYAVHSYAHGPTTTCARAETLERAVKPFVNVLYYLGLGPRLLDVPRTTNHTRNALFEALGAYWYGTS